MANQLVERGYLTQSLGSAAHSGEHGLRAVPGLLRRVIEEKAWENRLIIETGEEFEGFLTFEAYVKANPPRGLGAEVELIDKLIGNDEDLRIKFYAELRRSNGETRRVISNEGKISGESDIASDYAEFYVLQKLSAEGQLELLAQVKAGEISANEARKRANFPRPRLAIALDDPESAAKSLLSNASPEFLRELKRLLL